MFVFASENSAEDGEMFVKTCGDSWVVGKKSDQREFYVVINQKTANLIEINGEPFIESPRRISCTFGYVATDEKNLVWCDFYCCHFRIY